MIRFRPRRSDEPKPAPRQARVCVDGLPADQIDSTAGWVTVRHDDGSTPTVLANRVTPCTCDGSGCK